MDSNINETLALMAKKVAELDRPAAWVDDSDFGGKGSQEWNEEKWRRIRATAEDHFGAYPSIEALEDLVAYYKAKRERILTDDIPTFLAENGLKKVTLDDGTEVSSEEILTLKTLDAVKALAWVTENGGADLIKDSLAFGKGICDERLIAFLAENNYTYSRDSGIHSQTLKKFVSDRYDEMGTDGLPPVDIIEAKPFIRAKIKAPKK